MQQRRMPPAASGKVVEQNKKNVREMQVRNLSLLAAFAVAIAPSAFAQNGDTEKAIEKYRAMMREDPWSNPGYLDVDRGEALWTTKAGPKNASFEQCDLGKGPGKLEGAFAELPRYFADAGRVMDLETRLLWCRAQLQGLSTADYVKKPHPGGGQPVKEIGAIAAYVANKSAGQKLAAKLDQPKEKEAVALGEALFYHRSRPFD